MHRARPHFGATYRLIAFEDATFGVVVTILETQPTTVKGFATEDLAETWVARHKTSIADYQSLSRSSFKRKPERQPVACPQTLRTRLPSRVTGMPARPHKWLKSEVGSRLLVGRQEICQGS